MTQWILRSKRKITGGLVLKRGKRKKHQRGRDFLPAHVGAPKVRPARTKGGNWKRIALAANVANVSVKGKMQKVNILSVKENAADSQFVRRNIITKGAIIETDLGKARVTSRPGQVGLVNAVLIETTPKASDSREGKKA